MANKKAQFVQQVHQANLKCTYYDHFHNLRQPKVIYKRIQHTDKTLLQYAINNMAMKSGMLQVESISPEEYDKANDT